MSVLLSDDARKKEASANHEGLFKFKAIPFGLCNAPVTFDEPCAAELPVVAMSSILR